MPLRYPIDVAVSPDDFRPETLAKVLSSIPAHRYSLLYTALAKESVVALEAGRQAESRLLWVLSQACMMVLVPKQRQQPFQPAFRLEAGRSATAEDFSEADIDLFEALANRVQSPWLEGRLRDICWVRGRGYRHALAAIDAYRRLDLTPNSWEPEIKPCWERAIVLARQLGSAARGALDDIEARLMGAFDASEFSTESVFLVSISRLLLENPFGKGQEQRLGERVVQVGRMAAQTGNMYISREALRVAAGWFEAAKNGPMRFDTLREIGELWAQEALAKASGDPPNQMAAAGLYEKAIHALRAIPRSEREARQVETRIDELRRALASAGEASMSEMQRFSSGPFDITEEIRKAKDRVRGKSTRDALRLLTTLYRAKHLRLREAAAQMLAQHAIQYLFPAEVLAPDGRVIARRPGMGVAGPGSAAYEAVLHAETVNQYTRETEFITQAWLWPAAEVVNLEHRLTEADLVSVARESPFVPHGREELVGKGLLAGFNREFATAIHLLVPQIEHAVRVRLKEAGGDTTNLDPDGIAHENGLSSLVEMPQMEPTFGSDLTFELKALFCDPFGPNLRNQVAHGLLDQYASESHAAAYCWWFSMSLVFSTWWTAAGGGTVTNSTTEPETIIGHGDPPTSANSSDS